MLKGMIKLFKEDKDFGFIKPDAGGEDVFFHVTAMPQGATPKLGDRVSFELGVDRKTGRSRADKVAMV